jgi:curved DNA-binding protein CbpA
VQQVYKELMLKCHPDKNPGDEKATEAFQFLQLAFAFMKTQAATTAAAAKTNPD